MMTLLRSRILLCFVVLILPLRLGAAELLDHAALEAARDASRSRIRVDVSHLPAGVPLLLQIRTVAAPGETMRILMGGAEAARFVFPEESSAQLVALELPPRGDAPALRLRVDDAAAFDPAWAVVQALQPQKTIAEWPAEAVAENWTTSEGLRLAETNEYGARYVLDGAGPLRSPLIELPEPRSLVLEMRVKRNTAPGFRLHWDEKGEDRDQSVFGACLPDGVFHTVRFPLPSLSGSFHLTFNPWTDHGEMTIQNIRLVSRHALDSLPLSALPPTAPSQSAASLEVPGLVLSHGGRGWGDFDLTADGVALGGERDDGLIAIERDGVVRFLPLADGVFRLIEEDGRLIETLRLHDSEGGTWRLERSFRAAADPSRIDVDVTLSCDLVRDLLHVPWLTLFPGRPDWETSKAQALLAGIEYLADEPSSSEADLRGPGSVRRIPPPQDFSFPLAAIAHRGRCFGLSWEQDAASAAVFDSPNRLYNLPGNLTALWFPAVGENRSENETLAYRPRRLEAGELLRARATLTAAEGETIVPAVQTYVAQHGLPAASDHPGGLQDAIALMAHGWLDSTLTDGKGGWMHAIWSLPATDQRAAADACALLAWLAQNTRDDALRDRLESTLEAGRRRVAEENPAFVGGVSHVKTPAAPLLFGDVPKWLAGLQRATKNPWGGFDSDGVRHYTRAENKPDYSKTHFADHANGHAAVALEGRLETALILQDPEFTRQCIALLDRQTALYRKTAPRGSQVWEIPMHTPDVLASGRLVACYTIGYELTQREDLLEEARYWAWTGVPFVMIAPAFDFPQNRYATKAVLGATDWNHPNWIKRPVQWCGIVYADALLRLSRYDETGPWRRLAEGIVASGLAQTWPADHETFGGLLPDSINPINPYDVWTAAINPGTVQTDLPAVFDAPPLADHFVSRKTGWNVFAPGSLEIVEEASGRLTFRAGGFGALPYSVLVSGLSAEPSVRFLSGEGDRPAIYDAKTKTLLLQGLSGKAEIQLRQ